VLGVVSLLVVAAAPNVPVFIGGWALAGLAMAATFYQPAFTALTRWWAPDHIRALTIILSPARDAATAVREDGLKRFDTVTLLTPGEQVDTPPAVPKPVRALPTRRGDRRTIGRDDVLAAAMIQLFGEVRQRALAAAREATETGSDG
jgi:hypothetical protein